MKLIIKRIGSFAIFLFVLNILLALIPNDNNSSIYSDTDKNNQRYPSSISLNESKIKSNHNKNKKRIITEKGKEFIFSGEGQSLKVTRNGKEVVVTRDEMSAFCRRQVSNRMSHFGLSIIDPIQNFEECMNTQARPYLLGVKIREVAEEEEDKKDLEEIEMMKNNFGDVF